MKKWTALRTISTALFLLVLCLEAASQNSTQSPQAGRPIEQNKDIAELEKQIAGHETQPAETVFKNIQIFKGFQAARMLRIMGMFTKVLGVDCAHCHVQGEWQKEDKPAKQTARSMWGMMAKVNENVKEAVGKGTVNCYTCHRGQTKPALNPQ